MTRGPVPDAPEPVADGWVEEVAGAPAPPWTLVARGAFLFGRCLVCDHQSPARRARYSAESDMRAHTVICHATEAVAPEGVPDLEPERVPALES